MSQEISKSKKDVSGVRTVANVQKKAGVRGAKKNSLICVHLRVRAHLVSLQNVGSSGERTKVTYDRYPVNFFLPHTSWLLVNSRNLIATFCDFIFAKFHIFRVPVPKELRNNPFQKKFASIMIQTTEVSSAYFSLQTKNTYHTFCKIQQANVGLLDLAMRIKRFLRMRRKK